MKIPHSLSRLKCPCCNSSGGLVITPAVKTASGVQDGRLRAHDCTPVFYVACEPCGEDINTIDGHAIAHVLTGLLAGCS